MALEAANETGAGFSWVTIFLGLCVLLVILVKVAQRARFLYALRRVPSPLALPFAGNAVQLHCSQEEFFRKLIEWSKEFKDIFLLWVGQRPFIFLYHVETVQPLLSSNVHIDKSLEYEYLRPWLGTGLITGTGSKWRARRKMLTPSFHSGILEKYMLSSIREAGVLVSQLCSKIGEPAFDIVPYAKLAALDVICDTAMGYHINAQTNCRNEYVLAVDKITAIIQKRFTTIWIAPEVVFKRTSWGREHKDALEVIHNFTSKVIADRKSEWELKRDGNFNEPPKKRQALLDLLLEMAQNGNLLSDEDIREEVDTFMFAGHDTVATSISWILYALGRNPEYQDMIVEEYETVVGSGELTMELLNKLVWLDACIKESWRLYPVAPLIARQIYKPFDILGNEIPAGSTVLVHSYLLHRDPRHFPQPEVFIPERFLPGAPKPPAYTYIPFSAGSRNCIGKSFAIMEVRIMILFVLRAFVVHSVVPEDQLKPVAEIVLLNKDGISVTISPRNRHRETKSVFNT